jgi:hypothetical protein
MPLPIGRWKANVNGVESDLVIDPPNGQGLFLGTLFDTPMRGFWDEFSQTITFSVVISFEGAFPTVALFKGYLFRSPPNPEPGRDVLATLTGFVQVNVGAVGVSPILGTARRNVFGWLAQLTEVM